MPNKYIFGPINSRRFGLSLGIDLSIGKKQCNFDCLYCELEGAEPIKSQVKVSRVEDILDEVYKAIDKYQDIDVLTITANGEPTMYPHLQDLIFNINDFKQKNNKKIKTLILSNASTINNKKIQDILLDIDIVKLSLDAVDEKIFKKIDRANRDIKIQDIINGILDFRAKYKKELVIEILFVKNVNDKKEHIENLNKILEQINPNRIDISTIDRPPAYDVIPLSNKEIFDIANSFSKKLNVSVAYDRKKDIKSIDFSKNDILHMLKRRPQNEEDLNVLFSNESKDNLQELINNNTVKTKNINNNTFFVVA